MRQLDMTEQDKARMLDLIIDDLIKEYNDGPPVEKKFHSRAEKVGYKIIAALFSNGFVTNQGIVDK